MLLSRLSAALLLAASCRAGPTLNRRDAGSSANAAVDTGTFQSPSVHIRPKFRYWIPDASIDPVIAASDVRAAGAVGAGGIECLGYYLYGGPPDNAGRGTAAPVSWATYGFGTEPWNALFKALLQAHKDNGLIMDFAMGPNQGTGVPAEYNSDGLMWDLVLYNITVPIGGSFNGTLPGWGTGSLEAAITGLALQEESTSSPTPGLPGDGAYFRTQVTLNAGSLKDVTSQVSSSGHLQVQFKPWSNSTSKGLYNTIFAIYLIHSHYRAQDGPYDLGGPQTAPQTLAQNGSWAVDHFSELGAQTSTTFWEDYILQNGTRELLMEAGNYGWEDSVEIQSNVYWTKNFSTYFQGDHGYSVKKWMPILFHRDGLGANSNPSLWWITDESDNGDGHIADYRQTLTNQYRKYLSTLNSWAEQYLGLKFSSQVGYNLPMDMLANIPAVDVPECETLDFSDLIDGYRQYSGPAHLAGRQIVSNECGAVPGEAFAQTLPELLWHAKRAFAGSINQFVFHGLPYSGNYGDTTWPVYTTFNYLYSTMHGPHEPAWDFYRDQIDYIARNNYILQSGTQTADIAFWQKITTYPGHVTKRTYQPTDLEEAGYTYEYLSPDNFDLVNAVVQNKILAPDAQSFKALVVRANDSLTLNGTAKLVEFARAGLPIVFSGGIPTSYLGVNDPATVARSQKSLNQAASLPNVHITASYDSLASTLAAIGIQPTVKLNGTTSLYTVHRRDSSAKTDYFFVYNDAIYSPRGEGGLTTVIEFGSTGIPYHFNAWTGEQTPILVYRRTKTSTLIPLTLAGNQTTIVAFVPKPLGTSSLPIDIADDGSLNVQVIFDPAFGTTSDEAPSIPGTSLTGVSDSILAVSALQNGSVVLKVGASSSGSAPSYTLSNGATKTLGSVQTIAPITLQDWTLIVEHWDPPSNMSNIEGGAYKHNTTHSLQSLVSWQAITGLQSVSGRGYYSTTFTWPPRSNYTSMAFKGPLGAIIDFGSVVHTLQVSINGKLLPPLDVTDAKADISNYLVRGKNRVEAVVATPLGNVLRPIWTTLKTSGTGPSDPVAGGPPPPVADYGLIEPAVITPYWAILL